MSIDELIATKDKYGYILYGTREKCFFCGGRRSNTFRTPPLSLMLKFKPEERRAYEVCPTCLGRCNRHGNDLPHDALKAYCAQLDARGTVKGRVAQESGNLVWRLDLPFMHQDTWVATIQERVRLVTAGGVAVPVSAVVSDGVLVVTLDVEGKG